MTNFRRAKPPGGSTATALAESPGGFPRVGLSGLCQAVGCCRGGSLQRARCALRPHSQPPVIPHLIHPVLEGARKRGKWCREKDLSFSVHRNACFLIFIFFFPLQVEWWVRGACRDRATRVLILHSQMAACDSPRALGAARSARGERKQRGCILRVVGSRAPSCHMLT